MASVPKPAITRNPDIQGGSPVFSGTRIPVEIMLDYLEDGQPLDSFLAHYPTISRRHAVAALEEVKALLAQTAQMRIVLDEDIPSELTTFFQTAGHDAVHVEDLGQKGIHNGVLLERMSGVYDVLITGDTNMRFQQKLDRYDVAIVLLRPHRKVIEQLITLLPAALAALAAAPKGAATIVE